MEPIALRPRDAFAALGVGVTKGYELIGSGELVAFKIGRSTRITAESVKALVERRLAERIAA